MYLGTYIVDQNKNVVRFQFDEEVCAFVGGNYAIAHEKSVPCLIYITFGGKIMIYCNLNLGSIDTFNLTHFIHPLCVKYAALLAKFAQQRKSVESTETNSVVSDCDSDEDAKFSLANICSFLLYN